MVRHLFSVCLFWFWFRSFIVFVCLFLFFVVVFFWRGGGRGECMFCFLLVSPIILRTIILNIHTTLLRLVVETSVTGEVICYM